MVYQRGLSFDRLVECLESLISLVHCFQHKVGIAKNSRLYEWISFIVRPPGTPNCADIKISLECWIYQQDALGSQSIGCPADSVLEVKESTIAGAH